MIDILRESRIFASDFVRDKHNNFSSSLAMIETMDIKEESGRRIAESRKKKKLRQRAVCELIPGLTVSRLSGWEIGYRMISVQEALKLSKVLEVAPEYLLCASDINLQGEKADKKQPIIDEVAWLALSPQTRALIETIAQSNLIDPDIALIQAYVTRLSHEDNKISSSNRKNEQSYTVQNSKRLPALNFMRPLVDKLKKDRS